MTWIIEIERQRYLANLYRHARQVLDDVKKIESPSPDILRLSLAIAGLLTEDDEIARIRLREFVDLLYAILNP